MGKMIHDCELLNKMVDDTDKDLGEMKDGISSID